MLYKVAAALLLAAGASAVDTCSGDTRSPYTCDQDSTHRVCATLMESCSPSTKMQWGSQDFWALTDQAAFDWSADICAEPNPGDSWCICMWATEELIERVGCDSINLTCEGTDVCYVLKSYTDAGMTGTKDLTVAHDCITSKCPAEAAACSDKGATSLAQVKAEVQTAAARNKAAASHSMQA